MYLSIKTGRKGKLLAWFPHLPVNYNINRSRLFAAMLPVFCQTFVKLLLCSLSLAHTTHSCTHRGPAVRHTRPPAAEIISFIHLNGCVFVLWRSRQHTTTPKPLTSCTRTIQRTSLGQHITLYRAAAPTKSLTDCQHTY